jgi:hypothetical protein
MSASQAGAAAAQATGSRRWRLVGLGVIMSFLSILILLVRIGNPGRGLFVDIVGIVTTLFFVPLTVFLLYAAVRLGRRQAHSANASHARSEIAMPVFDRNRQSAVTAWSLSATVEEGEEGWRVSWFGDGKTQPPEFEGAGLTEVTDLAATAALAMYAVGPRPLGAMLGFAISPLKVGKKGVLYDVSGGPGHFKARDMQGSHQEVESRRLGATSRGGTSECRGGHSDVALGPPVRRAANGVARAVVPSKPQKIRMRRLRILARTRLGVLG